MVVTTEKHVVINEASLCPGVCAKILFLCTRPKVTQPDLLNALFGCLKPHYSCESDFVNSFLNCKKNTPLAIVDAANTANPADVLRRFLQKVKPLLNENLIENMIGRICEIIHSDSKIKAPTIINELLSQRKNELTTVNRFFASEFFIGIFLYAVKNSTNDGHDGLAKLISANYIETYSMTRPFSWEWTVGAGDLGAVMAYEKKSTALIGLLSDLTLNCAAQLFCVFGGVASKLVEAESCSIFVKWLSDNKNARLYLCYETGEAAEKRSRELNPEKIRADGLPRVPMERMLAKERNVIEAIEKFPSNVRERIGLIPISFPLNQHIVLIDDEVYWNNLNEYRSSENTTFRAQDTQTGIKLKCEQLGYIISRIEAIEGEVPKTLLATLTDRISTLTMQIKKQLSLGGIDYGNN